jgi:glutaredoxin
MNSPWNVFSVCSKCKRLCQKTPTSMCRYCVADYMHKRYLKASTRNVSDFNSKLAARKVLMSGFYCSYCDEGLRGSKIETFKDKPVCPYCKATLERLIMIPATTWNLMISLARSMREDTIKVFASGSPEGLDERERELDKRERQLEERIREHRPRTALDEANRRLEEMLAENRRGWATQPDETAQNEATQNETA